MQGIGVLGLTAVLKSFKLDIITDDVKDFIKAGIHAKSNLSIFH